MLALVLFLFSADPSLPLEIAGTPGAFITIKPVTAGKVVRFVALDQGLHLFPSELLRDQTATVASATIPGRYRVLAYTSIGDAPSEPAITTVVIGSVPPPPDVPPSPEDELATAITNLWGALQEAGRDENRVRLIGVYKKAVEFANNPEYETVGSLYTAMRNEGVRAMPAVALQSIRERAGEAVRAIAPADSSLKLTATTRADIAGVYTKLVKILEGLK